MLYAAMTEPPERMPERLCMHLKARVPISQVVMYKVGLPALPRHACFD